MDRLPALNIMVAGVTLVVACDERKAGSGDPPSRVNAAKTSAHKGATTESFCDVYAKPEKAVPLVWPALASGEVPAAAKTWRWINVWATWCKPCTEEIPRLTQWRDRLKVDLAFLSVDETEDEVVAHRKLHPETPASLRIANPKVQEAWVAQLGLTGSPPIPIHVFVDPANKVRCVRAGGVLASDYSMIERLLTE